MERERGRRGGREEGRGKGVNKGLFWSPEYGELKGEGREDVSKH